MSIWNDFVLHFALGLVVPGRFGYVILSISQSAKVFGYIIAFAFQNSSKLCIVVYDAPHAHLCCRNRNLRVFGKKHLNCQCTHIRTASIAHKDVGIKRMRQVHKGSMHERMCA